MSTPPDLATAELMDYTIVSGDAKVRLRLSDGVVIEVRTGIANIYKTGNDPATGFPQYVVQTQPLVKMVDVPKGVRKKPVDAKVGLR
jgi:hypothetical protein